MVDQQDPTGEQRRLAYVRPSSIGSSLPTYKFRENPHDPGFWDEAFYVLGKPEEWLSKTLGQLLTSDDKYNFDNTGVGNQTTFADVYADAFEAVGASVDPVIPALLGLTTAIVNPLDPLNKIKIAGLTRKGIGFKHIHNLAQTNRRVFKTVDGLTQIDNAKLLDRIQETQNRVQSLLKAGETQSAKVAKSELRSLERGLSNRKDLNEILAAAQKDGLTLDDIRLADSKFEQARLGQRRLIGLTSPFSMDHMRFFGTGSKLMDGESRSVLLGGFSGGFPIGSRIDAAVFKGAESLGNLGKKIAEKGKQYLGRKGYHFVEEQYKPLVPLIDAIRHEEAHVRDMALNNLLSHYSDLRAAGVPIEAIHRLNGDIVEVLTDVGRAPTSGTKQYLDELATQAQPDAFQPSTTGRSVDTGPFVGRSTYKDTLHVSPSGLTRAELQDVPRVISEARPPAQAVGDQGAIISGKYVILPDDVGELPDFIRASSSQEPLLGVAQFEHHTGAKAYVTRRPSGFKRGISATDPVKTTGVVPNQFHLANMELVAAQLANLGYAVRRFDLRDFLFNDQGEVLMIGFDRVAKAKKVEGALDISKTALQRFSDEHAIGRTIEDSFTYLETPKLAARAARKAEKFWRVRHNVTNAPLPKELRDAGVVRASTFDLLQQAENAEAHRRFVEADAEFLDALQQEFAGRPHMFGVINNIAEEVSKIRESIRAVEGTGAAPDIGLIEVARDDLGRLHIVKGRDTLAAAALENIQSVNVKGADLLTEGIDASKVYTGELEDYRTVFYDSPEELAGYLINAGRQADSPLPISVEYKVVTDQGHKTLEYQDLQYLQSNNLPFSRTDDLFYKVAKGAGRSPIVTQLNDEKIRIVEDALRELDPNSNAARYQLAIALRDMFHPLNDELEAVHALNQLVKQLTGISHVIDPTVSKRFQRETIQELRATLGNYLQQTRQRGVLTSQDLFNPRSLKDVRGVVVIAADRAVRVFHQGVPIQELETFTKSYIGKHIAHEGLIPFTNIVIDNGTEQVVRQIGDFVDNPHPALSDAIRATKTLHITDEVAEEFEKKGIYIARTAHKLKTKLDKTGRPIKYQPGKSAKAGEPNFERNVHSFYTTESGQILIDTKQSTSKNIVNLLRNTFGEGFIPRGEWGFVDANNVLINYPIGSMTPELTQFAMNAISKRLQNIAQLLIDAGYQEGLRVQVTTPFDASQWEKWFGKDVTLADMAKKSFKIKLPDDKEGMLLDMVVDAPNLVGRVIKPKFANDELGRAAKFVVDTLDDTFRREVELGLPVNYTAAYIPRVLTAEGEKAMGALSEAYELVVRETPQLANHLKNFMRQRTLPNDFTVVDINTFINKARQVLSEGADDPVTYIAKAFDKIVEEKDAAVIVRIAEAMNNAGVRDGAMFFHQDALYATAQRIVESADARAARRTVQTLAESGAAWGGSLTELKAARKLLKDRDNVNLDRLRQRSIKASEKLERAKNNDVVDHEVIAKLQEEVTKAEAAYAEGIAKVHQLDKEIGNLGPAAFDVDFNSQVFYIEQADARKLIAAGKLNPNEILNNIDGGIVPVRGAVLRNVPEWFGESNVYVFPEEAKGLVERYFGSTRRTQGHARDVLNFFDRVQDVWRTWTLYPIPAYHGRNFVSNAVLAWFGGYTNAASYNQAARIMKQVRMHKTGKATRESVIRNMQETKIINELGQETSVYDLWQAAVHQGVFTGGLHFNEYAQSGDLRKLGEFQAKLKSLGYLESGEALGNMVLDNKLLRGGKRLGQAGENFFRLGTFIDAWKRSGDFTEAGAQVKKIFYDYKDLNMFERSWMRRLVPFYSWMRFNTPRMLETMLTQPQLHYRLASFVEDWERTAVGGPLNEGDLPSWLEDKYGFVVKKMEDGTYVYRLGESLIPAFEVHAFFRADGFSDFFNKAVTSASPVLKVPIEQWMNMNTYTGNELEQAPGQPAKGFMYSKLGLTRRATAEGPLWIANWVLNEHNVKSAARIVDEASRLLDNIFDNRTYKKYPPLWMAATYDMVLGRSYAADPHLTRAYQYKDYARQIQRLESLYKYSKSRQDDTSAEFFLGRLNQLRLEKPPGVE